MKGIETGPDSIVNLLALKQVRTYTDKEKARLLERHAEERNKALGILDKYAEKYPDAPLHRKTPPIAYEARTGEIAQLYLSQSFYDQDGKKIYLIVGTQDENGREEAERLFTFDEDAGMSTVTGDFCDHPLVNEAHRLLNGMAKDLEVVTG